MFAAFLDAALDLDVLYLGVAISYLSIEINPYGVPYYQMGPHGVNNPTNDDMIYIYFSQVPPALSIPDYIHDMSSRMDHMTIGFPARFKLEGNGQYSVFFLGKGMEGCLTYGSNMEEAKRNAEDALDGYLRSLCSHRKKIQPPQARDGEDIITFMPSDDIVQKWLTSRLT